MVKPSTKDLAIAIWEHHKERTGWDRVEFGELEKEHKEVLLSCADYFIGLLILSLAIQKALEYFDKVDHGCENCTFLRKVENLVKD